MSDGGPAFPISYQSSGGFLSKEVTTHFGLTLRDYFAAKALAGMLAGSTDEVCRSTTPEGIEQERREYAVGVAVFCYRYADAMLKARNADHGKEG